MSVTFNAHRVEDKDFRVDIDSKCMTLDVHMGTDYVCLWLTEEQLSKIAGVIQAYIIETDIRSKVEAEVYERMHLTNEVTA